MPIQTDYEIKCTGCIDGAWVPLMRKDKGKGRVGRYYFTHSRGCLYHGLFDPDIYSAEELDRLTPDFVEIRKRRPVPLAKGLGPPQPLAKGTGAKGPGIGLSKGEDQPPLPKPTSPKPAVPDDDDDGGCDVGFF